MTRPVEPFRVTHCRLAVALLKRSRPSHNEVLCWSLNKYMFHMKGLFLFSKVLMNKVFREGVWNKICSGMRYIFCRAKVELDGKTFDPRYLFLERRKSQSPSHAGHHEPFLEIRSGGLCPKKRGGDQGRPYLHLRQSSKHQMVSGHKRFLANSNCS
jgi:hypothetical protein